MRSFRLKFAGEGFWDIFFAQEGFPQKSSMLPSEKKESTSGEKNDVG